MFQNFLNMWSQPEDQQPPVLPPPPKLEQNRFYQLIPFPTTDDLKIAARNLDEKFANMVRYAHGGSFAALIRGGLVTARYLEIVVEPGNLPLTAEIMYANPQCFGITQHDDQIVVVREDETFSYGVPLQRFELGTAGFPDRFIPPYDFREGIEYDGREPTYYLKSLELLNDRKVPFLRSRCLLYQKLNCFDRHRYAPFGQSDLKHLRRDILDIRAFLHIASADQEEPFPVGMRAAITQVVRSWIVFAEDNFVDPTVEDMNAWMRLGIRLIM